MTTITIPKKSIKDDLIIISRHELTKLISVAAKSHRNSEKTIRELALEAKAGKNIVGPFSNTKALFKSLGI